jgi:hypothetical protein
MVQPKYSPEEALQRVKLMMNYDLSKTSVENTKIIKEQINQPAQSTTNPSQNVSTQPKPTDVRRGKERLLKQPLKDDSVSILNCRKQIDDLYDAWKTRRSSRLKKDQITKIRDVVQACYDQHEGKFLLGNDANSKLKILSGQDLKVGGPLTNGETNIYRIEPK